MPDHSISEKQGENKEYHILQGKSIYEENWFGIFIYYLYNAIVKKLGSANLTVLLFVVWSLYITLYIEWVILCVYIHINTVITYTWCCRVVMYEWEN